VLAGASMKADTEERDWGGSVRSVGQIASPVHQRSSRLFSWAEAGAPEAVRRFREKLLGICAESPKGVSDIIAPLLGARGKLLRPYLVIVSALTGTPDINVVADVAAAIELVHAASLCHDDIMDKTSSRRGIAALHTTAGAQVAALVGSYLAQCAIDIIQHVDLPEADLQLLKDGLANAAEDECIGQFEEATNTGNLEVTESEYFRIIEKKTARLFEVSCLAGEIAGFSACRLLASYGRNFGLLYQILDDVSDMACSEAELGKAPGTDIRQGIYTLPIIFALQNTASGATLRRILRDSQKGLFRRELDEILSSIVSSDSLDRTFARASELAASAILAAQNISSSESRDSLISAIQQTVSRLRTLLYRSYERVNRNGV
jgi:heptaprenyl diphosphate synthase